MYQVRHPIQLAAVRPGEKALLDFGSASMGILAFLEDEEVDAILDRNLPGLLGYTP